MRATLKILPKPHSLSETAKRSLVPTAIVVWVIVTALAFWRYEFKYLLPVSRPNGAAKVDAASLPLVGIAQISTSSGPICLANPGHPVLLNFWNPECACSSFMEGHVHQLLARYGGKPVQFVTVIVSPGYGYTYQECKSKWLSRGFSPQAMPYVVDTDNAISRKLGVWAAPAAVIVDPRGRVEYIGAYNVSRFCDSDETAFAQKALDAVIAGQVPKIRTLPFYGCQITGETLNPKA